jgi:hypothetical protein
MIKMDLSHSSTHSLNFLLKSLNPTVFWLNFIQNFERRGEYILNCQVKRPDDPIVHLHFDYQAFGLLVRKAHARNEIVQTSPPHLRDFYALQLMIAHLPFHAAVQLLQDHPGFPKKAGRIHGLIILKDRKRTIPWILKKTGGKVNRVSVPGALSRVSCLSLFCSLCRSYLRFQ